MHCDKRLDEYQVLQDYEHENDGGGEGERVNELVIDGKDGLFQSLCESSDVPGLALADVFLGKF